MRLFFDLIAFAFASNRTRTATLQVGGCNDHTRYTINGTVQAPYHFISHRIQSDGDDGAVIENAVELHHQIDRIHARMFKYFLDRMSAYTLPGGGTLLDSSVNLWVNSVADGPPHSGNNIPHVFAGGANGFLITPLLNEMQQHRDRLKLIAQRNPRRPFTGEVQIIADRRTPFRTLSEPRQ